MPNGVVSVDPTFLVDSPTLKLRVGTERLSDLRHLKPDRNVPRPGDVPDRANELERRDVTEGMVLKLPGVHLIVLHDEHRRFELVDDPLEGRKVRDSELTSPR